MLFVLAAGAAGSVALLLHAAGRGVSPLLILLMVTWVVAPYAGLALARRRLRAGLIVAVTAASLAIYVIDTVWRLNPKAAFVYVSVPLAAWTIIAVTLIIGLIRKSHIRAQ